MSRSIPESGEWSFAISSYPVSSIEQPRFDPDLARLGIDRHVWSVLNSTIGTGTIHSKPLALRGFLNNRLAGIAVIIECRKAGASFFDAPVSHIMDLPGMPLFVWIRTGITIDQCANSGFVVEGIERSAFVEQAIRFLLTRYLAGSLVEFAGSPSFDGAVRVPFADTGVIDIGEVDSVDTYIARSKSLRRKLNKFRNQGGSIEIVRGALEPQARVRTLSIFEPASFQALTPFQDNYAGMVAAMMSIDSERIIHVIARLGEDIVGYHSFLHTGDQLHCQSGAFDRSRNTTYHAYENLIVESVRYAIEQGINRINFGGVLNPTKVKMMTGFLPCQSRTYFRYRLLSALFPLVTGWSKLNSDVVKAHVNAGNPVPAPFQ